MSKKYIIFTILLLTYLNSFSQNIPNDTIVKKDGTKIIDDFKTITVHNDYLITSTYEISTEKIESIKDKDLKKIATPLKEIDKVISNGIYQKILGDWEEGKIKMDSISPFERKISLTLDNKTQIRFTNGNSK